MLPNHISRRLKNSRLPAHCLMRAGPAAEQRGQHDEALRELGGGVATWVRPAFWFIKPMREKYRLTADSQDRYAPLKNQEAAGIRNELQQSLMLMPNFGPAHELSGFFEMVQGENLAAAEQHLQLAIQLEPENRHTC